MIKMKKLSGSSGRSLLLLITNILLMVFGAITVAAGSILVAIFLLHLFSFATQLFVVVPVLLIMSGTLTILVAIFGLGLFKRKHENSGVFLSYASIIMVALLISISASVTSFVLRQSIAHRFSKTDIADQLSGYSTDPFIRSRWDTIQREFRCCGGYNVGTGYTDWEGVSVEPLPIGASPAALVASNNARSQFVPSLNQVPDSCCISERIGCGRQAFEDDNNPSATISEKIYVNGCMTEARESLFKHVMPLLLICALVSLVVGLVQLLLLLCAVCFADHIKRLSSLDGSSTIGRSSSLSQEKQGIIQDTGEAYLSHEEKQLEYGLDNANPGFYDGDGLLGNEDDSASWSTTDTRIRHQLPLLDGSPSMMRKSRFFFQGSQASINNGYELQSNHGTEGGQENNKNSQSGSTAPGSVSKTSEEPDKLVEPAGLLGLFARIFGNRKHSGSYGTRNKELSLREDALDREATLMNVLKSVTSNKSEPDLVEATKETKSGFSFFGIRSKSKENVLDDDAKKEEVKKLPTLEDKTIDKNKKYPPMENLTDAGTKSSARSGLNRLKKIRDEIMFRKKQHQTLKEETETKEEQTPVVEDPPQDGATAEEGKKEASDDKDEIDFEEQKAKEEKDASSQSSSTSETSSESSSDSSSESDTKERKHSTSSKKSDDHKGSKVERKASTRSVHYEEDLPSKVEYRVPQRGSTFQRSMSETSVMDDSVGLRSISPNQQQQQRIRVSGYGNPPRPATRHLSTIHEPIRHENFRVRTRSFQVATHGNEVMLDNEVEQFNQRDPYGSIRVKPGSPVYNRSLSPQQTPGGYYVSAPPNKMAAMQHMARSEEQLNKPPVLVEYLRPIGILTNQSSQNPQAKRGENEGHVTRIQVEDEEKKPEPKPRRKTSSKERKEDDKSERKKKSGSKDDQKKKKRKKRKSSATENSSGSSDSESDSGSSDDDSTGSEADEKKRKKSKSSRTSRKDKSERKSSSSSRKDSKSKHRKKSSKRNRSESPDKKHRKSSRSKDKSPEKRKSSSSGRKSEKSEERVVATFESNTSPRATPLPHTQIIQRPHSAQQGLIYQESHDYMNMQPRMANPQHQQGYALVEDPRQQGGYYSTATLPSQASLRKASGYDLVPRLVPIGAPRTSSEPRAVKIMANTSTLDRYTLMGNNPRSKSAERVPIKYRRVSLDPTSYAAQPHQYQGKIRSISLATHEAGDLHVLNNSQLYRTTLEREPNSGEIYTVHQQQPGMRLAKTSSRLRMDPRTLAISPEEMMQRRQSHISEARLMVQGDGNEQMSLPHGVLGYQ